MKNVSKGIAIVAMAMCLYAISEEIVAGNYVVCCVLAMFISVNVYTLTR